mmetsp:Transcript_2443/g.3718  ORF Transcript_2443/g.3718 Transcript_2443/m.3718 type:complete len:137 (-) Transcript_2443:126-536(-)
MSTNNKTKTVHRASDVAIPPRHDFTLFSKLAVSYLKVLLRVAQSSCGGQNKMLKHHTPSRQTDDTRLAGTSLLLRGKNVEHVVPAGIIGAREPWPLLLGGREKRLRIFFLWRAGRYQTNILVNNNPLGTELSLLAL